MDVNVYYAFKKNNINILYFIYFIKLYHNYKKK